MQIKHELHTPQNPKTILTQMNSVECNLAATGEINVKMAAASCSIPKVIFGPSFFAMTPPGICVQM